MNTETTETVRGWVGYDAGCGICRGWAERAHDLLARRGYHLVPLQAGWVRARLGLKEGDLPQEMKLMVAGGRVFGGADALIEMTRSIWWAWPVFALAQVPGVRPVLRVAYRSVARNRHCLCERCPAAKRTCRRRRHLTTAFYELP